VGVLVLTLTSVTLFPPIDELNERSEQMLDVSDASSLSSPQRLLIRDYIIKHLNFRSQNNNQNKKFELFTYLLLIALAKDLSLSRLFDNCRLF
jgi:hypothetical protein